jgi:adenylate cyclase, class 2
VEVCVFEVEAKVVLGWHWPLPGAAPAAPGDPDGAGPAAARAVRDALLHLGAEASPPETEDDTFFRHPGRDLVAADEALRLRRTPQGYELTHKGPRLAGDLKARREATVRLADDPTDLLAALGFGVGARLRKTRERHRLRRTGPGGAEVTLEVTLDHVEGLGWFAEVECVGPDAKAAGDEVEAILRDLGLAGHRRVRESYVELALAAGSPAATRE